MKIIKLPSGKYLNLDRLCYVEIYENGDLRLVFNHNKDQFDTVLSGGDVEPFLRYLNDNAYVCI